MFCIDESRSKKGGVLLAELRAEVQAELTRPAGEWAIVEEDVLGERMPVFAERHRSLRELLQHSARFGDREYVVLGDWRISFAEHLDLVAALCPEARNDPRDRWR